MRLFFVTDLHGSELCFRKFISAISIYKADAAIALGDLAGKMVVPIMRNDNGTYDPPNGQWDERTTIWTSVDIIWTGAANLDANGNWTTIAPAGAQLNHRPSSKVYQAAISRPGNEGESAFFVDSVFSTLLPGARSHTKPYDREITVSVTTLEAILEKEGRPRIDFLNIDVEGTELDCLMGFDIGGYRPKLIFVEDLFLNLDLHRYLLSKGYRLFRRTRFNNWYVPKDDERYPTLSEKVKLFRKMYLGTSLRAWKRKRKKARLEKKKPFKEPVVTEIVQASAFYPAEEYHQQ